MENYSDYVKRTAMRLKLDESIKSLHSVASYSKTIDLINPTILLQ